jgi:GTP cyclohydrolase I
METVVASKSVTWNEVYRRLADAPPGRLYGIPRGGAIVAGLTGRAVDRVEDADWIVDDVTDSGRTAEEWTTRWSKPVWSLFDRERDALGDNQLRLPWEGGEDLTEQRVHLERLGLELLETLGYDPSLEGLRETPARWARWWQEFHGFDAGNAETTFQSLSSDELVVVSGIQVWSICEHHLLPFSALVSIGYVPRDRLLGLSKFARIAHRAAHRLQLQERLAEEIADAVEVRVASPDIGVLVRGRHLCMEARGIRTPGVASALVTRGLLRSDEKRRRDFLQLAGATPGIADPEHLHEVRTDVDVGSD